MTDRDQRTEQPTNRRLQKSRTEGRFLASREAVAAAQFGAFAFALSSFASAWFFSSRETMRHWFIHAFALQVTAPELGRAFNGLALGQVKLFPWLAAALVLTPVAAQMALSGMGLATAQLKLDFTRLNPLPRLGNLPRQNLASAVQALLLLPLLCFSVYVLVRDELESLLALPLASLEHGLYVVSTAVKQLVWKAAGIFVLLGCIDLFRQWRKHRGDLKMTKQEIREEMRDSEGNPQIKGQIRRLQRDRARRQMMKEIATATAVVVNPTHYAVAIRYRMETMAAPTVVAKGKNYLALRIKQRAIDHEIPIVENPPLAQALYGAVDVGQEIPAHLYRAVAEILAYIYRLMQEREGR